MQILKKYIKNKEMNTVIQHGHIILIKSDSKAIYNVAKVLKLK